MHKNESINLNVIDETNPAIFENRELLLDYIYCLARGIASGEYGIERGERLLLEIQKQFSSKPNKVMSLCSTFIREANKGEALSADYSSRLHRVYLDYLLSFSSSIDAREILARSRLLFEESDVKHTAAFALSMIFDGAYAAAEDFAYSDLKPLYDLLHDSSVRYMIDLPRCYEAVVEMWRSTQYDIRAPFDVLYCVMLGEEQHSILSWLCDVREAALRENTFDSRVISLLVLCIVTYACGFSVIQVSDKHYWKKTLAQITALYEWTDHGTRNLTEDQKLQWLNIGDTRNSPQLGKMSLD